jgi:hypothetical protein
VTLDPARGSKLERFPTPKSSSEGDRSRAAVEIEREQLETVVSRRRVGDRILRRPGKGDSRPEPPTHVLLLDPPAFSLERPHEPPSTPSGVLEATSDRRYYATFDRSQFGFESDRGSTFGIRRAFGQSFEVDAGTRENEAGLQAAPEVDVHGEFLAWVGAGGMGRALQVLEKPAGAAVRASAQVARSPCLDELGGRGDSQKLEPLEGVCSRLGEAAEPACWAAPIPKTPQQGRIEPRCVVDHLRGLER